MGMKLWDIHGTQEALVQELVQELLQKLDSLNEAQEAILANQEARDEQLDKLAEAMKDVRKGIKAVQTGQAAQANTLGTLAGRFDRVERALTGEHPVLPPVAEHQ
ncbi:hypothetical protein ABPG77_006895 [Micractinium sp. CCAP 211/92]